MKRLNIMLPVKIPPRTDKKYPTFIVITAIILSFVSISHKGRSSDNTDSK